MGTSVFTKIIDGMIPSYKIYEDEFVFAFLTKDAIQLGHTLIAPKVEIDYFVDVPEPFYSAVFRVAKPLAKAIHQSTGCKRIGTVIGGWDVPHFHYHLIPMFDYYDLDPKRSKQFSEAENLAMQEKIRRSLAAVTV